MISVLIKGMAAPADDLVAVGYGHHTFVAVNYGHTILTSPDGVTWTRRSSGIMSNLGGVTYGKNTFVAVGMNGTIIQSGVFQAAAPPTRITTPSRIAIISGILMVAAWLAVLYWRRLKDQKQT